jgi:hypothetical protein
VKGDLLALAVIAACVASVVIFTLLISSAAL